MRIVLFLIAFFYLANVHSQITFQKLFGYDYIDIGYSVETTQDDGYLICGGSTIYEHQWPIFLNDTSAVYIIKTDEYGNMQWSKVLRINENDWGHCVTKTMEGGYTITGTTLSDDKKKVFLLNLDENGTEIWRRIMEEECEYCEYGNSIVQTWDSGYIIAGYACVIPWYDAILVKTDKNGNTVWHKYYGGDDLEYARSVVISTDSGYVMGGVTYSNGNGASDMYLVKTDQSGKVVWSKTYGGPDYDEGYFVQRTNDGGYIFAGVGDRFNLTSKAFLVKTDQNGDTLWTKKYSLLNRTNAYCVRQTSDSGYILTGLTENSSLVPYKFLLKTDRLGNTEWSRIYDENVSTGYCVMQMDDGCYVLTGAQGPYSENFDVLLMKVDEEGLLSLPELIFPSNLVISAYPNPSHSTITIELPTQPSKNTSLTISNTNGQQLITQPITELQTEIDITNLSTGIYIVKVWNDKEVMVKKIIKQ